MVGDMENLKIKVNNEDESKEIQELLFEFGCYWAGRKNKDNVIEVTNGWYIFSRRGEMTYCDSSEVELNGVGFSLKEITLQYLRYLVVLKRNSIDDASLKDAFGDIWYVDSNNNYWMFENGIWREADKPLFKLEPIKKLVDKEVKMKEYLDSDYELRKVKQTSGDNHVPSGWIEIPEGAEILYFDKRYESANHFFKTVDGNSYYKYLENGSRWMEYRSEGLNEFKDNIDNFRVMWQRNATTLDSKNTSTQDKLKFIEKWLNGEKIQYILGIETDKSQWHNFTEGAMQYIKRSDIKFREAPKYVTINGIEFKSVEKLVKYVKKNFDLEDVE